MPFPCLQNESTNMVYGGFTRISQLVYKVKVFFLTCVEARDRKTCTGP